MEGKSAFTQTCQWKRNIHNKEYKRRKTTIYKHQMIADVTQGGKVNMSIKSSHIGASLKI